MNRELADQFKSQAVRHLTVDFIPKLKRCLESLSEDQVWWRPNEQSTSVGNILLHLSGNVRQWIIAGLGGTADLRKRDEEFAARGPIPAKQLLDLLETTVAEAKDVIAGLEPRQLLQEHRIQVYDVSALQAIFHVVEHFSYHTGQVIYVTKLVKDEDLEFYAELNPGRRFER